MKDSYRFFLKLSIILVVSLLILYLSTDFFKVQKENFSPASALFENAKVGRSRLYGNPVDRNKKITLKLDKQVLENVLGVDLNKMTKNKNVSGGKKTMPNYDYCNLNHWIPRDAIRSICPNCDSDKL
jgi:hypothetical protein